MNQTIVLVRPIYSSNVGMTARAMTNMGFDRLVLIGPHCEVNSKAKQAAATGQGPLENRVEYSGWEEFMEKEGDGLRLAMTARAGRLRMVSEFSETVANLRNQPEAKELSDQHVYIIFGPEDAGLSNDDLKYTHKSCYLETYGKNFSLNLAQATLVTMFLFRQIYGGGETREIEQPEASVKAAFFPDDRLARWIELLGFETADRRVNAHSVLRRILLENVPTRKELKVLEAVLNQNIRKLESYTGYLRRFGPLQRKGLKTLDE